MKLEQLLNHHYHKLNENDTYIAACIIKHKEDCLHLSIDEFAFKYHMSKSSLSRFAQKLSLSGYSQLRSLLRLETTQQINKSSSFLDCAISNYHKMIEYLKDKDLQALFKNMYQAKRILIFASGFSQARVAKEMKRIFLPLQIQMYDMHGHDMAEAFASLVTSDDVVFLLSLSGESNHMIELAKSLSLKHIHLISITRMSHNSLATYCHENLYVHSITIPEDYPIKYEITTPYFILIEMLFLQFQAYIHNEHNFNV